MPSIDKHTKSRMCLAHCEKRHVSIQQTGNIRTADNDLSAPPLNSNKAGMVCQGVTAVQWKGSELKTAACTSEYNLVLARDSVYWLAPGSCCEYPRLPASIRELAACDQRASSRAHQRAAASSRKIIGQQRTEACGRLGGVGGALGL